MINDLIHVILQLQYNTAVHLRVFGKLHYVTVCLKLVKPELTHINNGCRFSVLERQNTVQVKR